MKVDELADHLSETDDVTTLTRAIAADPTLVSARTLLGDTLLHVACRHARLEAARALIGAGADTNARGSHGWRPLHCAVNDRGGTKALPFVRLLMEHGADPSARDDNGFTPVTWARQELWDRAEEVLPLMTAPPADDFEATRAQIHAIEARSHTELALFRMLEAFGRDEACPARVAAEGLPAADLPRLEEMSLVLKTLGSSSWAEAARAWIRESVRPGDLRRFTELDGA